MGKRDEQGEFARRRRRGRGSRQIGNNVPTAGGSDAALTRRRSAGARRSRRRGSSAVRLQPHRARAAPTYHRPFSISSPLRSLRFVTPDEPATAEFARRQDGSAELRYAASLAWARSAWWSLTLPSPPKCARPSGGNRAFRQAALDGFSELDGEVGAHAGARHLRHQPIARDEGGEDAIPDAADAHSGPARAKSSLRSGAP